MLSGIAQKVRLAVYGVQRWHVDRQALRREQAMLVDRVLHVIALHNGRASHAEIVGAYGRIYKFDPSERDVVDAVEQLEEMGFVTLRWASGSRFVSRVVIITPEGSLHDRTNGAGSD